MLKYFLYRPICTSFSTSLDINSHMHFELDTIPPQSEQRKKISQQRELTAGRQPALLFINLTQQGPCFSSLVEWLGCRLARTKSLVQSPCFVRLARMYGSHRIVSRLVRVIHTAIQRCNNPVDIVVSEGTFWYRIVPAVWCAGFDIKFALIMNSFWRSATQTVLILGPVLRTSWQAEVAASLLVHYMNDRVCIWELGQNLYLLKFCPERPHTDTARWKPNPSSGLDPWAGRAGNVAQSV